jgi:hypothetical protein
LNGSINSKSGGVDNIHVVAFIGCDSTEDDLSNHHFGLSSLNKNLADHYGSRTGASSSKAAPVGEPSMDGDEGDYEETGPHCSSDDFPCEGGSKVYICHYSVFKGYNTYCVAEEDTDVIRFYPNDYCGPCVGGYGGQKPQSSL